ncbi:HNH endonuclease signature motif containing protein, partial [Brevibacterium daeguense]
VHDAGAHRNAHGPSFALVITATAEQLARGTGTATTQNRTPIPISTVLQHACTAKTYLQTWDDTRGTITLKTDNRLANKNQLTLLAARDQGCSFPDCDIAPIYCQAHHMLPHSQGGPTDINNLTLVCPYHHAWHDPNGWTARLSNGLPAWIPPRHLDPKQQPIHHSKFRVQLIPQLTDLLTRQPAPAHTRHADAPPDAPPDA